MKTKLFLIFLMALSLGACTGEQAPIQMKTIQMGMDRCISNGGMTSISHTNVSTKGRSIFRIKAYCSNGATFDWSEEN